MTPVADVRLMFSQRELLEAALFTEEGSESSALLGIATRWDIAALQYGRGEALHEHSGRTPLQ
jgi:hypothetical protein